MIGREKLARLLEDEYADGFKAGLQEAATIARESEICHCEPAYTDRGIHHEDCAYQLLQELAETILEAQKNDVTK